jgi:hypothetical protein
LQKSIGEKIAKKRLQKKFPTKTACKTKLQKKGGISVKWRY